MLDELKAMNKRNNDVSIDDVLRSMHSSEGAVAGGASGAAGGGAHASSSSTRVPIRTRCPGHQSSRSS